MSELPNPIATNNNASLSLISFGIIISLGTITAASVLGTQLKSLKQSGTITVKV